MKTLEAQNRTLNMVYVAMFAVMITICAWISIPTAIPFTLQTFGVFVTIGLLGGKRGTAAVLVYLLLGVLGIPVFSGFQGGIGVLGGITGGYIVGLILAVLVMWGMERIFGRKVWILGISMLLGIIVCYFFGTFWVVKVYTRNAGEIGWMGAMSLCVFPFVVPDLIKILLALFITKKLTHAMKL